jgi:hypothetical protein
VDAELVHQAFEMIKARDEEIYKEVAAKAAKAKAEEAVMRYAGAAGKEITEDGGKVSAMSLNLSLVHFCLFNYPKILDRSMGTRSGREKKG